MKIPTLDAPQVQSSAAPQAKVAYLQKTGMQDIGQALGQAGKVVQQIQIEERNKADQAAVMDADVATSQLTNELYNQAASTQLKDAMGVAPKALQDFDTKTGEIEKTLKNDRQKRVYGAQRQQARLNFQKQVETHERNQTEAYYNKSRNDFQAQQFTNGVTHYSDPVRVEQAQENIRASVDMTPGLDAEQKKTEFAEKSSKLYGAAIDRYLVNDQIAAGEAYYKSVKDKISGPELTQIENSIRIAKDRLRAKAESNLAEERQAYRDRAADVEADFRSRIPVESIPSEAEAVALFGEQRGKRMHEQLSRMQQASIVVANFDNVPTGELPKLIEGYKPSTDNRGALAAEVYQVAAVSGSSVLNERNTDAVGYLQRKSPAVSDAYRRFNERPSDASRQEYLSAIEAERVRLGIPGQEILSKGEERSVVERMTRQDDSTTLVASIRAEQERWGPDFPRVFQQVAKDVPDVAYLIPNVPQKAADVLASVSQMSPQELEAAIPVGASKKEIETDVATQLAELRSSFPIDGLPAYQKIEAATVKLAIGYMQSQMSSSTAIKQAVKDSMSQHQFYTYRDRSFRVPFYVDGAPVDTNAVEVGASEALRSFRAPDRIVPQVGDTFAESERVTADIKRNAYWVTAPDESGLWLFNRYQPVGNPPIAYTWQQLQALAAKGRSQAVADFELSRSVGAVGGE